MRIQSLIRKFLKLPKNLLGFYDKECRGLQSYCEVKEMTTLYHKGSYNSLIYKRLYFLTFSHLLSQSFEARGKFTDDKIRHRSHNNGLVSITTVTIVLEL